MSFCGNPHKASKPKTPLRLAVRTSSAQVIGMYCGHDQKGLPPTLVQVAELDVLHSDGERLATKMTLAGVKVTLETYKGVLHGFLRFMEAVGQSRKAIASGGKWLKALAK